VKTARVLLLAALAGAALAYASSSRSATGRISADQEEGSLLDELLAQGGALLDGGNVKLSDAGLALLKHLEGFSPTWYRDAGGHSIGYGHFGDDLTFPGEAAHLTHELAGQLLALDVQDAERVVSSSVRSSLTQAQFDSLVCFAYNVGAGAFRGSTLLAKINAGDYTGAASEFARWRFARDAAGNKVENTALAKRRQREAQLFAMNDYGSLS
jgi:lysozyme